MAFSPSITRRVRRRVLTNGTKVKQTRHVLQFKDPNSGKRRQLFFERRELALAKRDELVAAVATGKGKLDHESKLTVADAVAHWLESRRGEVKNRTWYTYKLVSGKHVTGRLGQRRVAELTTSDIRSWHKIVAEQVGARTAQVSKTLLGAALSLAAEDFDVHVPRLPSRTGARRPKPKKDILSPEEVAKVIRVAMNDERGVYYAFPFLTGVRPSEQLGLLWESVDFSAGVVRIQRVLEREGTLCDVTKTAAGMRDIPMGPTLRSMLLEWKGRCPSEQFVFPAPNGGRLLYWNFRRRMWQPGLAATGVRYVTPHSARHTFISTLQANGFEVGLVAKLAGHTPAVSLSHYTQAVRAGAVAMAALEQAFATAAEPS